MLELGISQAQAQFTKLLTQYNVPKKTNHLIEHSYLKNIK